MEGYTREDLTEALRTVESIIHKCGAAQRKFLPGTSHYTLLERRLKAMSLSQELILRELAGDGVREK